MSHDSDKTASDKLGVTHCPITYIPYSLTTTIVIAIWNVLSGLPRLS